VNIILILTAVVILITIFMAIGIHGITPDGDFSLVIIPGILGDILITIHLEDGGIMITTILMGITPHIPIPLVGSYNEGHSIAGLPIKDLMDITG
jgi:hypothetical protein